MAQLIIFLARLGRSNGSEIIIIFVPIFPAAACRLFGIDPLFFGILVALNLQTSFLTPPWRVGPLPEGHRATGGEAHADLRRLHARSCSASSFAWRSCTSPPHIVFYLPNLVYGPDTKTRAKPPRIAALTRTGGARPNRERPAHGAGTTPRRSSR